MYAVACLLTTACSGSTPELGDICGTVKDNEGHAIQNATVSLEPGGSSRHTNSEGYYIFEKLAPQEYTVKASANGYVTDTRTVLVEIDRTKVVDFSLRSDKSQLEVNPQDLDFETNITTKTLTLSNKGHATLNWSLAKQIDWLSCSPSSGTLKVGESVGITFRADRSMLQKGTKTDKVIINSNGGNVEVTVSITVTGISVSWAPSELDFGNTQSVLGITFSGGNDVSYVLIPSNSWIIPSKLSGTFTKTENLTVAVKREGLAQGSYEGYITIKVGDQSARIPVRMGITSKEKPTANMIQVKDVGDHSATFQGAIVSVGSSQILHHGFCWSSTSPTPELGNAEACDFGDISQARNLEYTPLNLLPGTSYWVRVYAENSDGTGYSQAIKFTTDELPQVPQVTTGNAADIKAKSARLTGEILKLGAKGGIVQHGHVWSLYANPTTVDAHTTLGATEATGAFISDLTGLSPATTYHVRAYATNSVGTNYGDDITFTTLPDDMSLTTSPAADITHRGATLGGQITYGGGNKVTEQGVCVGLAANPTVYATCFATSGQQAAFTIKATGLKAETTYHARAYAKTESGLVYYGNNITFTTSAKPDGSSIDADDYDGENDWNN